MDSVRLESLKNKGEHAQSAIASQEVREHLAGFIRSKLGSSTQINPIVTKPSPGQTNQPTTTTKTTTTNNTNHNNHRDNHRDQSASSHDHPLRKTTSMPTMHIPYKAQSLSRRRQMERRTTMSPLMKRKSRPRQPLLRSLDGCGATEYSSNPCIMQSAGSNQRSSSQSNSPPPPFGCSSAGASDLFRTDTSQLSKRRTHHDFTKSSSQTHLSDRPNAFSAVAPEQLDDVVVDDDLRDSLRQQHMRVQEAIRKTIISRASSRNRMVATGGSLDSEMSASRFDARTLLAAAGTGGDELAGTLSARFMSLSNQARNREELRQWSLDGADMRANWSAQKEAALAAANRTLAWGLFHREFHRLKLATTSDAATLRRSQSPVSSISMGGQTSGGQPAAIQQQQQQQSSSSDGSNVANAPTETDTPSLGQSTAARLKHYSSSSSTTSSLLSGQDSLEDSSSQAIDLSSSSETSRHHHKQHLNSSSSFSQQAQLAPTNHQQQQQQDQQQNTVDNSNQSISFNYQKVLQESFNQLQLCQGMKPMSVSSTHPIERTQLDNQSEQQQQQQQQQQQPMFCQTDDKPAVNLDIPCQLNNDNMQGDFLTSLSQQFNLSASAQNLILAQDQQNQLNSMIAQQQQQHQQQHDLNHWLMAYNNLVQSSEFQQSNQITSSLLTKITSLPEPYKSALLAQMIIQQQQQQIGLLEVAGQPTFQPDCTADQHKSTMIARALSSPMLIASNDASANNIETPMQSIEFEQNNFQADNNNGQHKFESANDASLQSQHEQQRRDELQAAITAEISERQDMVMASAAAHHYHLTSLDLSVSGTGKRSTPPPTNNDATHQFEHSDMSNGSELAPASSGRDLASHGPGHSQASGGSSGAATDETEAHQPETETNTTTTTSITSATSQLIPSDKMINCNFLYNPVFDQNSSTGLVYELELCNHKCICNDENNHPENSLRVLAIWRRLHDSGLMAKCARIESRRASLTELQLCHGETYANYFGRSPYERIKLRHLDLTKLPIEGLTQLECGGQGADIDTAWNEEQTPGVARLAVGCAIEAAVRVASGKLLNAFAVVRPPGHHAEHQQAMGFCFFNSVAIAARVVMTKHQLNRVLIVDWDVHHGNGIQRVFYEDNSVMYISLHRSDGGGFFPGSGHPFEVGAGAGVGFNWNVAFSDEIMGDAEYLAAFRSFVMPIAREFNPSMVLVACGFDGAAGHPFNFGGYELSPACYAHMTSQLMSLANGRLVLCLEGGYQLAAICDCAQACVQTLLSDNLQTKSSDGHDQKAISNNQLDIIRQTELERVPNESARLVLHELSQLAAEYWPSVASWRHLIDVSAVEAATKTM